MDAVGDVADGRLGHGDPGPQVGEHVAGHLAVQRGDAVASLREVHAHHRHVEPVGGFVLGPVAESHQVVERHAARLDPRREVLLDQFTRELVDPGGHRSVRREHRTSTHRLQRLVEAESVALHERADALESEESGVTLVGVEHAGRDAERLEGADAADPQQHLLAQAVLDVAAVETVGDQLEIVRVLGQVGVEQEQWGAADLRRPDLRLQRTARHVELDPDAIAQFE